MRSLTSDQHDHLENAIQSLEREVLGELVVVIAKSSDTYRFIPTLWAALAALALPGVYLIGQWLFTGGWTDSTHQQSDLLRVYIAQVTLFFTLLLVFHWAPIQRVVVPSYIYRQRSSRLAHQQFLTHRLHHTSERCGALVFISLQEHHIEIMVDKGLSMHTDNTVWDGTIARMSPLLRRGDVAEACGEAIDSIAETMRMHCPRDAKSPKSNELPNHVIEI